MQPTASHRDLQTQLADAAANICRVYKLNPVFGRIYAVLFLATEPMSLTDLAKDVGIAKSTASVAVRKLEMFRMIRRINRPGDRRDYFTAVTDPSALLQDWLRRFAIPELEIGQQVTDNLVDQLAAPPSEDWPEDVDINELRQRMEVLKQVTDMSAVLIGLLTSSKGDLSSLAPLLATASQSAEDPNAS